MSNKRGCTPCEEKRRKQALRAAKQAGVLASDDPVEDPQCHAIHRGPLALGDGADVPFNQGAQSLTIPNVAFYLQIELIGV